MALIYKDGQFYESSGGTLRPYKKTGNANADASAMGQAMMAYQPMAAATVKEAAIPATTPTQYDSGSTQPWGPEQYDPKGWAAGKYDANGVEIPQARKEMTPAEYDPKGYAAGKYAETIPNVPVTPAITPANTTPAATVPATTTTTTQADPWAAIMALIDKLGSGSNTTYNNPESYTPSTSTGQLSQALTDRALSNLDREYGYTPEEEQAIYDRQMARFNSTLESDQRNLEGKYEQLGLRSGAGDLGGQAGSSMQDYMGKRAIAEADLAGQILEQIANKRTEDENATFAQGLSVNDQLYNQVRGDFADTLAMMQFNAGRDDSDFAKMMTSAGYLSDQQQQDVVNAMNDRAYWQSATGLTAETAAQMLTNANSNELQAMAAGMGIEESALMPILLALAMGGNGSGTGTGTGIAGLVNGAIDAAGKVWNAAKGLWEAPAAETAAGIAAAGGGGVLSALAGVAVPAAVIGAFGYAIYDLATAEHTSDGGVARKLVKNSADGYNAVTAYAIWKGFDSAQKDGGTARLYIETTGQPMVSGMNQIMNAYLNRDTGGNMAQTFGLLFKDSYEYAKAYMTENQRGMLGQNQSTAPAELIDKWAQAYAASMVSTFARALQGDEAVLGFGTKKTNETVQPVISV